MEKGRVPAVSGEMSEVMTRDPDLQQNSSVLLSSSLGLFVFVVLVSLFLTRSAEVLIKSP